VSRNALVFIACFRNSWQNQVDPVNPSLHQEKRATMGQTSNVTLKKQPQRNAQRKPEDQVFVIAMVIAGQDLVDP